jgi:serine protease Do
MTVAAKLISPERNEKKWHGVKLSDTPGQNRGVTVASVDDDSPAFKCGLKAGDVITAVDEQPVVRALDFERAMIGHDVGQEIAITVRHNNQPENLNLALAASATQKDAPTGDAAWELLGLKLAPIAPGQFQQFQSRYHGGLSVVAVRPDSPAAKKGIRRGDVLVGMHIWETTKLSEVDYVLNRSDFADLQPIKFYLLRGNETLFGYLPVSLQRR